MTSLITCHDVWSVSVIKKLNVLSAIFEKYPNVTFLHFLAQYAYKLTKTLSFSYSKLLVITFGVFLWEKIGMFTGYLQDMWQNLIFQQKWNLELIEACHMTTLITCHDVWSVSVIKKLNIFSAIFEKYPKK